MNPAASVQQSQVENEEGFPSIIDDKFLELGTDEQIERINLCTKLFGREERQRCLFDTFNNSLDNSKGKIIIIKGDTGCGKTALVNSLRDELRQTNGTLLLEWTCERQAMLQLYSRFTNALPKWVQDILSCESNKVDDLKSRLQNCLNSKEIETLIKCWPIISSIFGCDTNVVQDSNDKCNWGLLLKFLTIFSSKDFPLCIWVDDLHWIDNISFQWILNLLHSTFVSTEGMSFVLSYNHPCDEGEEALFWKGGIQDLKTNEKLQVFEMTIENLHQNAVTNWVDYVLGTTTTAESSIHVSHYLYTRTNGHALYTKELLKYLLENSCVNYCSKTKSWEVTMKD
jgi:predicted ATPase